MTGAKPVDGFIGRNTERALAKALDGYDGNDVLGYLADLPHKMVEKAPELDVDHKKVKHPFLAQAMKYLGLEEIVGALHNVEILRFWKLLGLPFKTDEIPWCAAFIGGVLEELGYRSTRSGMARSYLKWGEECDCEIGAIVIYWRVAIDAPTGHVGAVAGLPVGGFVPTLGGNQGNRVCVKPYDQGKVLGYRKPKGGW